MATFSIFGTGAPTGTANDADATPINLFTGFYLLGVTGWSATGVKFWLDGASTAPTTGYSGYLWSGSNASTATQVASVSFSGVAAGQWNTATFSTPVSLTAGQYYWVSVYYPGGKSTYKTGVFNDFAASPDTTHLFGASNSEVSPGNGAYGTGAAGSNAGASGGSGSKAWYGVDVIVSDGASPGNLGSDAEGITDGLSYTRSGFSTTVTLNAAAKDELNVTTAVSPSVATGGSALNTYKVSLMGNRIVFGSALDSSVQGPTMIDDATPYELGVSFWVTRDTRITGARIYKHPGAAGSIPVTMWNSAGATLATKTLTWTADEGGWREVLFTTPVTAVTGQEYRLSYYAANNKYAATSWAFNAQDHIEPPFLVKAYNTTSAGAVNAGVLNQGSHGVPNTHFPSSFYVDVLGEVDLDTAGYKSGYMGQWVNHTPTKAFPVAVFFPDPEWLVDYAAAGVTTIVGIQATNPGYRAAIIAANVDVYATIDDSTYVQQILSDPTLANYIKGYLPCDEPDLAPTYRSPQDIRDTVAAIRKVDSTRPIMINFGTATGVGQGWSFLRPGTEIVGHYNEIIQDMEIADIVSVDHYNLAPQASQGRWGVWTYGKLVDRVRQFSLGQKAVWAYVETTSQEAGYPTPTQVVQATWASLIAGAKGIVFFDHRFGSASVTQDFAALLHDAPMKSAVTSLATEIQAIAGALNADEAGLITSVTSSNTTQAVMGGTAGVPIHYSSRIAGTKSYVLAQSIRPGTTTGTFTVPSAAGKTLTVRGESRTVTANGSGVFTDSFASDYAVHVYEWTT
jgi:hypothetical protein